MSATELDQLSTIAIAALLGGIIGLEREIAGKPAGLRTHVFVAMSAALLMVLGDVIMVRIADLPSREYVSADPMRMIQAIIIGVSFLGAGTIVHAGGDQVEGLTTAASILLTCCVGIAVALHLFLTSLGVTAVAVVVLLAVGFFERRLSGGRKS